MPRSNYGPSPLLKYIGLWIWFHKLEEVAFEMQRRRLIGPGTNNKKL